jgi:hypothetical protein
MRTLKTLSDLIIISLFVAVALLAYSRTSILFAFTSYEADLALSLLSNLSACLTAICSILVASYLLASQIIGRKPYSRFVRSLYHPFDLTYFGVFIISIMYTVLLHAALSYVERLRVFYLIDISVVLFIASLVSLVSILLKNIGLFNPKIVAHRSLNPFNVSSVRKYGLILVEGNNHNEKLKISLKTWGHRHNLFDPLGAYHDILMEAVHARERVTFHLYINVFVNKLSHENGARLFRCYGTLKKHKKNVLLDALLFLTPNKIFLAPSSHRVEYTAHALHYLVRRARNLLKEWKIDTHRQIFVVNLGDLVLALSNSRNNALPIQLCLHAILRICCDYKQIELHGSYEPVSDLFELSTILHCRKYFYESDMCLRILAYLKENTSFFNRFDNEMCMRNLPKNLYASFQSYGDQYQGITLKDAFPESLWHTMPQ